MKKVCFLISALDHSGGTERVTTLIANSLAKRGFNVSIISSIGGTSPFFKLDERIKIFSLYPEATSIKKHTLGLIKRIRAVLVKEEIETLIVVDSINCVFTTIACRGLKINHICWEHFNLSVNLGSKFRSLGRWMAVKWCSQIVTLTERDKQNWETKYRINNKVKTIFNPSTCQQQQHMPDLGYKTILCVGRLTQQKGFDLLISAWSKIASEFIDWKIIIVGSGEDELILKNKVTEYGLGCSVIFKGQQQDVAPFYLAASFFCMSSRFEGLPMVLLEAQSYSLPIVAFDCDTGPAEIVQHNISGFLVNKLDVDDMAGSLRKMMLVDQNTYKKMCKNALRNTTNFDLNSITLLWEKVVNHE
ncbi:glycosyltransferase family 4 protein [Acinetobacter higginsii]|uniref:glycosyltransferase family 4 protein n=1 Tax=Acinetobacter higginsii TaxID=70347 RepID=UPI0026773F36|nr:glycosyltransferase family 4 protein [Acinetobacter higginsii]MDO3666193.1 glycosyltransferase family 4 protein [Acinetobacter higginsii]